MIPKERQSKLNNSRYMVTMELRAKSEPKEFSEKSISAHQYSARDMSVQADSEEREENATMVNTIDLKSKMQKKINIYDLTVEKRKGKNPHNQPLIKETKDVGVLTEFHRRLYCSQDWFYSELFKDMLTAMYAKTGDFVPDNVLKRWNMNERNSNYMRLEDEKNILHTQRSEDGEGNP